MPTIELEQDIAITKEYGTLDSTLQIIDPDVP